MGLLTPKRRQEALRACAPAGGAAVSRPTLAPTHLQSAQPFRSMGFVSVIIVCVLFGLGPPLVLLQKGSEPESTDGPVSPETGLAYPTNA